MASLARAIGMVTQETYLFYDTIRANLLYANPVVTDAQMVEAAKAANIHDFIVGLPDKYDTVVGERGYRLSGGERQMLAIAIGWLARKDEIGWQKGRFGKRSI